MYRFPALTYFVGVCLLGGGGTYAAMRVHSSAKSAGDQVLGYAGVALWVLALWLGLLLILNRLVAKRDRLLKQQSPQE